MSSKGSKEVKDKKRKSSSSKKSSKRDTSPEPRKKRAKKDKDAPKRAMSAYILFSNDHRARVKQDRPDVQFGQVAQILAAQWKECSPTERTKYEQKAAKDKARYQREKEEYEKKKASSSSSSSSSKKSSKKSKKKEESEDDSSDNSESGSDDSDSD